MVGRYVTFTTFSYNFFAINEIEFFGFNLICGPNKLSWNLDNNGGWASDCSTNLNTNTVFRKMMYYCPGVSGCTACPAGKFSTTPGASACIDCAAGKYSVTVVDTSASACTNCAAGTYLTTTGATASSACQYCPFNRTSAVGSSLLTACVCKADTYRTLPFGIQQSYPISNIATLGCTVCYDQPYSHCTTSSNIESCKTSAGSEGWILMGSKTSTESTSFSLVAAIKARNFVMSTSTTVAYLSNEAYWYYVNSWSIGFAPSSSINLNIADNSSPEYADCANRLSWLLEYGGGYRSGCRTDLTNNLGPPGLKVNPPKSGPANGHLPKKTSALFPKEAYTKAQKTSNMGQPLSQVACTQQVSWSESYRRDFNLPRNLNPVRDT
jgi:hypothetical protein